LLYLQEFSFHCCKLTRSPLPFGTVDLARCAGMRAAGNGRVRRARRPEPEVATTSPRKIRPRKIGVVQHGGTRPASVECGAATMFVDRDQLARRAVPNDSRPLVARGGKLKAAEWEETQ
jgi:hypothetical protein